MPVQVITNVPADKVATYKQIYENAGATSVTTAPESDGEFTLIVVFPDQATLHSNIVGNT